MHASFLTQSWCSLFLSLGQMEWFLRLKKGKSLEDWGSSFFFFHFYNIVLVFAIQQHKSAMIMYTPTPSPASPLLPHPTPPGHHRAPDWTPCATKQLLTTDPSCTRSGHVLTDVPFSIHPTFSLPYCVHKSTLYLRVSFPSLQIGSLKKTHVSSVFLAALFIKARVHLFYEAVSTTWPFSAFLFHLSNEVICLN